MGTSWGCDTYCAADDLACGNGTIRALHTVELFGEDWLEWMEGPRGGRAGEPSSDAPVTG